MSESTSVRRVIALRVAWYATAIGIPTLALAWARDHRERWVWLVWEVACLSLLSSPLSRAGRWLAVAGVTGLAAVLRWTVLAP